MPKGLSYTDTGLDRAALLRRKDAWTAKRLRDPDTRILPVWRNRNLIRPGDTPKAASLKGKTAQKFLRIASDVALLGVNGKVVYFAADASDCEPEELKSVSRRAEFIDLRQVGPVMEPREAAILAYARAMMYWHRNHRYCGVCGSPTENRQGGHVRVCTGADCERPHFPRTDPAVIMLVTRLGKGGEACLLARQAAWPEGMYSTLAGFVEPGERLEEAVVREVLEESGVSVADVEYRNSQPWPFPASLMVGFRASATSRRIKFDKEELEDARWFTRDEIGNFEKLGFRLPRSDSIARWLVDTWLAEE
ncbi:MAG: NAD(+) diphosphatase [Rhodospirillales bacterium]|jgi:NAD+ diphosphatase|nr:NAD(+) diphosphatase [Rhodospirillales bacterium]MDP6775041.1 NAD(+) diphosphatase [Rhodospirillales bacterium]